MNLQFFLLLHNNLYEEITMENSKSEFIASSDWFSIESILSKKNNILYKNRTTSFHNDNQDIYRRYTFDTYDQDELFRKKSERYEPVCRCSLCTEVKNVEIHENRLNDHKNYKVKSFIYANQFNQDVNRDFDYSSLTKCSKRRRTIFTTEQLEKLESEFHQQQYLVGQERKYLAKTLGLNEVQVKVWFQNRRIKWRKSTRHLNIDLNTMMKIDDQTDQQFLEERKLET